jgi:hypothetical protein
VIVVHLSMWFDLGYILTLVKLERRYSDSCAPPNQVQSSSLFQLNKYSFRQSLYKYLRELVNKKIKNKKMYPNSQVWEAHAGQEKYAPAGN